jgi:transposase
VRAFRHERQSAWFDGIEAAFEHFGGVPQEVLLDNARALVDEHDAATREVRFNARLSAFARYWSFRPRACAPYRARTKGKDERGVGYVKHNAIAGHRFASWAALEAHLAWWMREIADVRDHGTTDEAPIARFQRAEATALRPLDGRPPFRQVRELVRRVQADCAIELDTNSYSVPWRLIGETVQVVVAGGRVSIRHAGCEVAVHPESTGQRQRVLEPAHFAGVVGGPRPTPQPAVAAAPPELLRPLREYERLVGGGW